MACWYRVESVSMRGAVSGWTLGAGAEVGAAHDRPFDGSWNEVRWFRVAETKG